MPSESDRIKQFRHYLPPINQTRSPSVLLYPASLKTKTGTKWGYINVTGNFVIPPQFAGAEEFQRNGLAVVRVKERSGVINAAGRFVIEPRYNSISPFSEGLAVAIDEDGFKVIDEAGRQITAKPYSYIGTYQDQRAVYAGTNAEGKYLYGYLDSEGKEVLPLQFETANDFKEGKALVRLHSNEYALIGLHGERIKTFPYANMGNPSEGLLSFQKTLNNKTGFVDEKGNIVIAPQYSSAQPFQEGRAVVSQSDHFIHYGLIDAKGKYVIVPRYNEIRQLGERRAALGVAKNPEQPYMGSYYAVVDTDNGRFLTHFLYDNVEDFKQGLSSVSKGRFTFFIDRSGSAAKGFPIIPGTGSLSFDGHLIRAYVDQRVFYYNRAGKLVWRPNTLIPLNQQYIVREEKYSPNKDYLVYYPQVQGMMNHYAQQTVNMELKKRSQVKPVGNQATLGYTYTGDFSIEFFKRNLLVLELNGYQYYHGAAHGMPSEIYAHVDLVSGRIYELKDLFKPGSNYVETLSDIIAQQIKTNPEYSYVFPDSYKGIKADQPFYVTEEYLAIYFFPYEIAPYAAGFPTFKIPYAKIMNIVDVKGDFWRSFH